MHAQRAPAATTLACLLIVLGLWSADPQAPTAVQAAERQPARQGAWLDSLVFTVQADPGAAISQLQAGELDVYANALADPALFQRVLEDPLLTYTDSYGQYHELTFNPAGPEFYDGRLNPFSNAAIREAMNRLVDRDLMAQEMFGGMATPKFVYLTSISSDAARYRTTIDALEAAYAYDLAQAQAAISAEMTAMGATPVGGLWHYDGQPVTLIFLIRVEDRRLAIGNYVADQLEAIGFAVDRQYKTLREASPIWNGSDPAEGQWHLYTGGWVTGGVSRDGAENLAYFYTPLLNPSPLWQAYRPMPAFYDLALRLYTHDYATMAERDTMFEQALPLSLSDAGPIPEGAGSLRAWLVDQRAFNPRRAGTAVVNDLAGGLAGARMFPLVARFEGVEGGVMRVGQPGLLNDPWNPIAGSNWIYDQFPIRATQDDAVLADPHTGLAWPQRIESAECVVKAGLPVTTTLDWVTLSFSPTIPVPADAWAGWDAASQMFITAAGMPTPTLEANVKCTVTYPPGLFTTVAWHDGSPLDLSDFVLRLILEFDRAQPESLIYDEAAVPQYDAFMAHFRGVVIEQADPLVITTYDDRIELDAERMVNGWWPTYRYGPGAWHNMTPAVRAEEAGELAFSPDKADMLAVPWTDLIGGESLAILAGHLPPAGGHDVPYPATMNAYVTQAEAITRADNLRAWYQAQGHFWLGTGAFYLDEASWDPNVVTLAHFSGFPDLAGRWDAFAAGAQPMMTLNYTAGAPGSYLNLSGSGFPPGETAFILVNENLLDTAPVDASGTVSFTLSTDGADVGLYHVRVTVNPAAGVQFRLLEDEPLRPREGDLPVVPVPPGISVKYHVYLPLVARGP